MPSSALDDAAHFALGLPEVMEQDHHGLRSFRVRNSIFATVPDAGHLRIMVDEAEIHAAIQEHPECCQPFFRGTRLACVVVDVQVAPAELVQELLVLAWLRKAPAALRRSFEPPTPGVALGELEP